MTQTRAQIDRLPPEPQRADFVEFAIPPIVDRVLFDAVQHQLRQNQARAARNGKIPYLLGGGRLRCARCGSTMTGYRIPSGSPRYKCAGMTRIEVSERCYATTKAEPLEARVWAAVQRVLEDPELVAREVWRQHAAVDERRASLRTELQAVESVLVKCDREEERWRKAYAAEVIELDDLKGYLQEIDTRRQGLRA